MVIRVEITTIFDDTPSAVLAQIATRARARRLAAGLTRAKLAAKAGVSVDVVKRLEGDGRVSLESLARLAMAMDATDGLRALFPDVQVSSLRELEQQAARRSRVYGTRRDAGKRRGPTQRTPKATVLPSEE